ncbi:MAG: protein translocase subunit SecF [Candidatus Limiplasma sp.]|nr:protein translocase subunit SecF [Candidatus Limiplasma sp.]
MKLTWKNNAKLFLSISVCVMLIALVMSLFGLGLNYGIDFAGGLNIEYNMNATFDQADVETALRNQGLTDFKVSTTGTAGTTLSIRIPSLSGEDEIQNLQNGLETELLAKYPAMDVNTAVASYVGPTAGATLVKNAVLSVLLASLMMLGYIALRFDLFSGMAAVIGLLHDVLIMLSFMVLLRNMIQMNSSFIAAMLTIVGYSINNTIVIFDRIRENNKKPEYAGLPRTEVVTTSIRQSLGRTINTTLTTLVTIITLYIMGVPAIREFSLPIIIGILAGLYSANLINGYVWAFLEEKFGNRSKRAKKLNAKKA